MSAFADPEGEEKNTDPLPLRGKVVLMPTEPLLRTLLEDYPEAPTAWP